MRALLAGIAATTAVAGLTLASHTPSPSRPVAVHSEAATVTLSTERGDLAPHYQLVPPRLTPHVSRSLHRKPLIIRATPKATPHVRRPVIQYRYSSGAEAWASGSFARKVANCESGGDPTILDSHTGVTYFGEWQMNADFVQTYGHVNAWNYVSGGHFTMPRTMQDEIAYRGWLARGWQPWQCASMV